MIIDVGNNKKRTHRVTVLSLLNKNDTKSFSIYCPDGITDQNLIDVCKEVIRDPATYFDDYIDVVFTGYERKQQSHTILVFNLNTKKTKSANIIYPQYSSHQLARYIARQMNCEVKPYIRRCNHEI